MRATVLATEKPEGAVLGIHRQPFALLKNERQVFFNAEGRATGDKRQVGLADKRLCGRTFDIRKQRCIFRACKTNRD
ncbi:hypothetical protein D3C84_1026040 [compost metagenome]